MELRKVNGIPKVTGLGRARVGQDSDLPVFTRMLFKKKG